MAAIVQAAMQATSQLVGGVSDYFDGKTEKKIYRNQAKQVEKDAQNKARQVRAQARRLAGSQRARFGASGVDLSGSAIDVMYDSAAEAEAEAMGILQTGANEAANLRTQGNQAYSSGLRGLVTSFLGAGGSVVGGVSKYNSSKSTTTNAPTTSTSN